MNYSNLKEHGKAGHIKRAYSKFQEFEELLSATQFEHLVMLAAELTMEQLGHCDPVKIRKLRTEILELTEE